MGRSEFLGDDIMPTARKQLGQAIFNAAGTGVTVYTVPGATIAVVKSLDIANLTAVARPVRIHLVPNGVAAGTSNALFYDLEIPAYGALSWEGAQILDTAGDFIYAETNANNAMTVTVSGIEET